MKEIFKLKLAAMLLTGMVASIQGQIIETHEFPGIDSPLPDGNASGFSDRQVVNSAITELSGLRLHLQIEGEFNGDLYGYVRQIRPGQTNITVLLNRPGRTSGYNIGYADHGLDVWFDNIAPNGDIHLYQSVTIPAPGSSLTGSWQPDGRKIDPESAVDTTPRIALFDVFQGSPASGEWTLFLADVESGGTNMLAGWKLEFTGKETPAISWPTPSPIVYGTLLSTSELNATSPVAGTFTYTPPIGTVLNAGDAQPLSVTFNPDDASSYESVVTEVAIDVQKKPLTITASDQSKIYGAPLPTFAVTYNGFVNGESELDFTTPVSWATTATAASDVGQYPIVPEEAVAENYQIQFVPGVLTITKATLTAHIGTSLNPALPGVPVTFTATLTAVAPGAGIPTGLGQFYADGIPNGTSATLESGMANTITASLSHGYHVVRFDYEGDGNFHGVSHTMDSDQLINTPPAASPDLLERPATNGTKVLITDLLSNDADADGDTFELISSDLVTANDGTVTLIGDWIHYEPANGDTTPDAFNYTIQDSFGATALAAVTVQIAVDTVPSPNLLIENLSDDLLRIRFDGIPGLTYRIQFTDSMIAPDWQLLGSATADAAGLFLISNSPPPELMQRYYRSVYP